MCSGRSNVQPNDDTFHYVIYHSRYVSADMAWTSWMCFPAGIGDIRRPLRPPNYSERSCPALCQKVVGLFTSCHSVHHRSPGLPSTLRRPVDLTSLTSHPLPLPQIPKVAPYPTTCFLPHLHDVRMHPSALQLGIRRVARACFCWENSFILTRPSQTRIPLRSRSKHI